MSKISRRDFMRGAAVGTMGVAAAGLLTGCGNSAASSSTPASSAPAASSEAASSSAPAKPSAPVDGKYVTKGMGHESWVYVATTAPLLLVRSSLMRRPSASATMLAPAFRLRS